MTSDQLQLYSVFSGINKFARSSNNRQVFPQGYGVASQWKQTQWVQWQPFIFSVEKYTYKYTSYTTIPLHQVSFLKHVFKHLALVSMIGQWQIVEKHCSAQRSLLRRTQRHSRAHAHHIEPVGAGLIQTCLLSLFWSQWFYNVNTANCNL